MGISLVAGLAAAVGKAAITKTAFAFGAFVKASATFMALGAVGKALLPKGEIPTLNTGQGGTTISGKNSVATRKLIYGKTRVGGTIVFSGSSGDGNRYLWQVYAIADTAHRESFAPFSPISAIESLESVYFGDELIATISGGSLTYEDGWQNYVQLFFYDGSQTFNLATLSSDFSQWTSDHKLQGVAYVAARFDYDQERYANGLPNLSFVVKGRKVYDPRQDSTSSGYDSNVGLATHREDEPETWTYSNNPALCLLDYMRDPVYGLDEPLETFNMDALLTARDTCADQVTVLSGTHERYTCDGVIDSGNKLSTNIENILTSMVGKLYYSSGAFFMYAVADSKTSESTTITEDMMIGGISLATKSSRRNQYNTVKGQFNDEDSNYIATDYPTRDLLTYIAADGDVLVLDVNLPMTTNHFRAQRIAHVTLAKSRQQATINLKLNLTGMRYKVGDNVKVSYSKFGYVEKVFEIQRLQIIPDPELGVYVDVTAVEDDPNATIYDTSTAIDIPAITSVSVYDGKSVDPITSITASFMTVTDTSLLESTPKLQIRIEDAPSPFITHYKFYIYRLDASDPTGHNEYLHDAQSFTLGREVALNGTHLIDIVDRRTGLFKITCQAVNINGILSSIRYHEFTVTVEDLDVIIAPRDPVVIVQQSFALTEPTNAQLKQANNGLLPKSGDVILYQQVQGGVVLDSITYEFSQDLSSRHIYHNAVVSTSYKNPNSSRMFMDVFVQSSAAFGTPSTRTYSAVLVAQEKSGTENYATMGTTTFYTTQSEMQSLDGTGTIFEGENVYNDGGFDVIAGVMNDNPEKVSIVARFEIDSQYLGSNKFTFFDRYKIVCSDGTSTIETAQLYLNFFRQ